MAAHSSEVPGTGCSMKLPGAGTQWRCSMRRKWEKSRKVGSPEASPVLPLATQRLVVCVTGILSDCMFEREFVGEKNLSS